jgi:hypothetical protein
MRGAFLDAYEANPVPEPATVGLLSAGALLMMKAGRRPAGRH